MRTQRWKYCVTAPDRGWKATCRADHYVEQYLYDLQADPYELTNLAGLESHPRAADVLRERLLRLMGEAGEAPVAIDPAPPRPSRQRIVTEEEAFS